VIRQQLGAERGLSGSTGIQMAVSRKIDSSGSGKKTIFRMENFFYQQIQ